MTVSAAAVTGVEDTRPRATHGYACSNTIVDISQTVLVRTQAVHESCRPLPCLREHECGD